MQADVSESNTFFRRSGNTFVLLKFSRPDCHTIYQLATLFRVMFGSKYKCVYFFLFNVFIKQNEHTSIKLLSFLIIITSNTPTHITQQPLSYLSNHEHKHSTVSMRQCLYLQITHKTSSNDQKDKSIGASVCAKMK